MANRYDMEDLCDDVLAVMTTYFNAKLTEINAAKNDGIVLDPIDSGAYSLQQLNGKMLNYNPFCLYGIEDIETVSQGPLSSDRFQISVTVVVKDSGEELECGRRMFRYSRALKEVFEKNWNDRQGVKFEIKSLVPVPLPNLNDGNSHRAVGIVLEGTLS